MTRLKSTRLRQARQECRIGVLVGMARFELTSPASRMQSFPANPVVNAVYIDLKGILSGIIRRTECRTEINANRSEDKEASC